MTRLVLWIAGSCAVCASVYLLLMWLVPRPTISEFTTPDGQTYVMESTHYAAPDGKDAVQVSIRPKR